MQPITLTIETGSRGSLLVSCQETGIHFASAFASGAAAKKAAERFGVPATWVDEIVGKYRKTGEASYTYTPPDPVAHATATATRFKVRDLASPDSAAVEFASFADALAAGRDGQVIRWDDRTAVACLDYDWHNGDAPPANVIDYAYHANPAPSYAWVTRSGGLRLVYLRHGSTGADVLAAVAAYSLVARLPDRSPELKNETRTPPGEYRTLAGGCDLDHIRATFSEKEVDESARDEYLDERGLALGQRLPHSHCVIDSSRASNSPNPVTITETGIRCYSCEAHLGNGFRSWASLLGNTVSTPLASVVRNRVHWEHARYILAEHMPRLGEGLREAWYKAALTVYHGTDVDIAAIFATRHLVRFAGYWGTPSGEIRTKVERTLARLPAVLNAAGEIVPERHEAFQDTPSISHYGYYPLRRVFGMKTSTRRVRLPNDDRPILEIFDPSNRPTWVPDRDRMSPADAWATLETAYPGVDRGLVELYAFAKMIVELGSATMPPMFLLEGVSSSGKTSTPKLAAAILGDRCGSLFPNRDDARTAMSLFKVLAEGTFVTCDEVVKTARKFRLEPRSHLDFLLQITPETTIDVKYLNPVSLSTVPVLTVTDTEFDDEILGDVQLGRRLFYADLGTERRDWKSSTAAAGLVTTFAVRSVELYRHAADSLLCHWVDKYFSSPFYGDVMSIDDVAADLGVGRLESRPASDTKAEYMRSLFNAWVEYRPTETLRKHRTPGPDYKTFKVDPDSSPLAEAWSQLHDDGDPMTWSRAGERSWQVVLGRSKPVKLLTVPTRRGVKTLLSMTFREEVGPGVWEGVK